MVIELLQKYLQKNQQNWETKEYQVGNNEKVLRKYGALFGYVFIYYEN